MEKREMLRKQELPYWFVAVRIRLIGGNPASHVFDASDAEDRLVGTSE